MSQMYVHVICQGWHTRTNGFMSDKLEWICARIYYIMMIFLVPPWHRILGYFWRRAGPFVRQCWESPGVWLIGSSSTDDILCELQSPRNGNLKNKSHSSAIESKEKQFFQHTMHTSSIRPGSQPYPLAEMTRNELCYVLSLPFRPHSQLVLATAPPKRKKKSICYLG